MISIRLRKHKSITAQSKRLTEQDLAPILACAPPTQASLAALQGPGVRRIAFLKTGFHRLPPCTNPEARVLQVLLKSFRHSSVSLRFHSRENTLKKAGQLSQRKMVKLFEDFSSQLERVSQKEMSAASRRLLRPLREITAECLLFAKSRPKTIVRRQFGELLRSVLEVGFLSVYHLEHGEEWQKVLDPSLAEEAKKIVTENFDLKSAQSRMTSSVIARPPSPERSYQFGVCKGILLKLPKAKGQRVTQTPLSRLARNKARFFFAHQEACLEIFSEKLKNFQDDQKPAAYEELLKAGDVLYQTILPSSLLATNVFTIKLQPLRGLADDMRVVLGSEAARLKLEEKIVKVATEKFTELLVEMLRWQAWCTPFVHSFSRQDVEEFSSRPMTIRDHLSCWSAAGSCIELGGWLNFRYRGGDPSPWKKYTKLIDAYIMPSSPKKRILKKMQKLFPAVVKAIIGANKDFAEDISKLRPEAEQIRMLQFCSSKGTEAPQAVIDEVAELQKQLCLGLEEFDPEKMQAGLITPMEKVDLTKRIKQHDGVVLTIKKSSELLAAYLLCLNQSCLPEFGKYLREKLASHQLYDLKPEGDEDSTPFVLCDLVVRKPGSQSLRRTHGEDPYTAIHNQFIGMVQAEFPFAEEVCCAAICRKNNPALKAHQRRGWRVAEGETYVDKDGLPYHIIYLKLRPAYDLI